MPNRQLPLCYILVYLYIKIQWFTEHVIPIFSNNNTVIQNLIFRIFNMPTVSQFKFILIILLSISYTSWIIYFLRIQIFIFQMRTFEKLLQFTYQTIFLIFFFFWKFFATKFEHIIILEIISFQILRFQV